MDNITGGSVLFWFVAMLIIAVITVSVCIILTRLWPGVRVSWKTGAWGAVIVAAGHTAVQVANEIWYMEVVVGSQPAVTEVPLWLNLGSWILEIALAALVTFVVFRLRRVQGWVFFLLLAVLSLSRIYFVDPTAAL